MFEVISFIIIAGVILYKLATYKTLAQRIREQDADPYTCVHSNEWHKNHPNGK